MRASVLREESMFLRRVRKEGEEKVAGLKV
jgi:hypothetical protein